MLCFSKHSHLLGSRLSLLNGRENFGLSLGWMDMRIVGEVSVDGERITGKREIRLDLEMRDDLRHDNVE